MGEDGHFSLAQHSQRLKIGIYSYDIGSTAITALTTHTASATCEDAHFSHLTTFSAFTALEIERGWAFLRRTTFTAFTAPEDGHILVEQQSNRSQHTHSECSI